MARIGRVSACMLVVATLAASHAVAAVPLAARAGDPTFRDARLDVQDALLPLAALGPADAERLASELDGLGVAQDHALYDVHTGRWASLVLRRPFIAGSGVGNELSRVAPRGTEAPAAAEIEKQARDALFAFLTDARVLQVDTAELATVRVTVHEGGDLVHIHAERVAGGFKVRDAGLSAVVNHGNLVLLGLSRWADADVPVTARVGGEAARAVVAGHLGGRVFTAGSPRLELVPLRQDLASAHYDLRPAWSIAVTLMGDPGTWEALVDATHGALLAFEDHNLHASVRKVVGGVYPVSNDGLPPDGVEQPGFPMPSADVTVPGTATFTNANGVAGCFDAGHRFMSTTLAGRYVTIADGCGTVRERWLLGSEMGVGDLGHGPGTDCAVPPGHSAGDTHAARTAFYELNRIAEQARGYLPANTWLQAPLLANVNVPPTCGAFWNGTSVTFFRGGGSCRNVGEIAGVLDHEWGHGLDDNDANATISNPSEAIADIHAILRLDRSCLGRGFFSGGFCGGYGDPCTECTGARDLDWAKHVSGMPHDIAWVQTRCPAGTAPCGRQPHCASLIVSEAFWDLRARDLPTQFGLDDNTALELTTRLAYLGTGLVSTWYACTPPAGGCGALGGYLNLLAADDDNGNLADGTPHMTAIHAAFDRHQIACATPPPANSGCAGGPSGAPALAVTSQDGAVALSWTAVAGAARYAIYRAEGVHGCAFGKTRLGETTATTFVDSGLLNGFAYSYSVMPIGANGSCLGRMSACQQAIPSGPGACLPRADASR